MDFINTEAFTKEEIDYISALPDSVFHKLLTMKMVNGARKLQKWTQLTEEERSMIASEANAFESIIKELIAIKEANIKRKSENLKQKTRTINNPNRTVS